MVERRCAMMMAVRPLSSSLSAILDQALRVTVHVGGGLVQDEDARVGNESSCECNQLSLPHAQVAAPLVEDGVVALRHAYDELVGA